MVAQRPDVPGSPDQHIVVGAMYDVPNIQAELNKQWPAGYKLVTAVPNPRNDRFMTLIFERR